MLTKLMISDNVYMGSGLQGLELQFVAADRGSRFEGIHRGSEDTLVFETHSGLGRRFLVQGKASRGCRNFERFDCGDRMYFRARGHT
jgi:hypothetical protein